MAGTLAIFIHCSSFHTARFHDFLKKIFETADASYALPEMRFETEIDLVKLNISSLFGGGTTANPPKCDDWSVQLTKVHS